MKKKIHYHSDCPFFAGCENMLVNFLCSSLIRQEFDISFSYRYSFVYEKGLKARVKVDFPIYPMIFWEQNGDNFLPAEFPLRRYFCFMLRVFLTIPTLLQQIYILRKTFIQIQPDILHINNGGYPAALSARAAAIAGKLAKVPHVIMVVNNMAEDYFSIGRILQYFLDKLVINSVNLFITGSKSAREHLTSVLKLENENSISIHNGISLRVPTEDKSTTRRRLGVVQSDLVFGVVSILRENKGHQVLLQSIYELKKAELLHPNTQFLIEGEGPLEEKLKKFSINKNIQNNCHFIGHEENISNFINMIDVLIFPSISHEDFPNIILEAMGFSKPVIASSIAGTTEQIQDGETGFLVTPKNVEELSTAILKLMNNSRTYLDVIGSLARKRFQDYFTAEKAIEHYVSLYLKIVSKGLTK